jgi:hypothetical protein
LRHSTRDNSGNMSDMYDDGLAYDDEDVYDEDCPALDELDASVPLRLDLNTNPNASSVRNQGETRAYRVTDGGIPLYESGNKTDSFVSVQRLLWVDGWQGSPPVDEKTAPIDKKLVPEQHMTLVVLNFIVKSTNPGVTIGSFLATLTFKDKNRLRSKDPEVQAWAPFHEWERKNASVSQHKTTRKTDVSGKAGYSDYISVSGERSKEHEISWERTEFDEGWAQVVNNKKGKPNGVRWYVAQNPQQNQGAQPELWTAVLLSRASPDPYLVKFRISVRAGKPSEYKENVKNMLWLPPGDGSAFTANPRPGVIDELNCHLDGHEIMNSKAVDLYNLGRLRESPYSSVLAVSWGVQHLLPSPRVAEAKKADEEQATRPINVLIQFPGSASPTTPKEVVESAAKPNIVGPPEANVEGKIGHFFEPAVESGDIPVKPAVEFAMRQATHDLTDAKRPLPSSVSPPLPQETIEPDHDASSPLSAAGARQVANNEPALWGLGLRSGTSLEPDTSRLVALEARAAQTEARLAAQDLLILQLQRAVDVRDARLARMEQAIRTAAAALSQLAP